MEGIRKPEEKTMDKQPISTDAWYLRAVLGKETTRSGESMVSSMLEDLRREQPTMLTGVMERTCNLNCTHCLYQPEKSSKYLSGDADLSGKIERAVMQLPEKDGDVVPRFLHCGRILMPWHLDVFKRIKEIRPDIELGLIDNGTYVKHIPLFEKAGVKLSWIDISLDGMEEAHNTQRDPVHKTSFKEALEGLRRAREIVLPNGEGKVSSLFTLTRLNIRDIEQVADLVFSPNERDPQMRPYVDTFGVTTMSPAREPNAAIEISPNFAQGDVEDFKAAWEQIRRAALRHNEGIYGDDDKDRRFLFSLYRHQDLEKLARAVGPKVFLDALENDTKTRLDKLTITVDGVEVSYSPLSIWPKEETLIDADGMVRTAYSGKYTLGEHRKGLDSKGSPLGAYTVGPAEGDLRKIYQKTVEQWWENFGKQFLAEEIATIERIRSLAREA